MTNLDDEMTNLNPADLAKMTAFEVADLADLDHYAVRDEGFRRQALAEKKLAKLQKQMAAAMKEMAEAGRIIEASIRESRKAA